MREVSLQGLRCPLFFSFYTAALFSSRHISPDLARVLLAAFLFSIALFFSPKARLYYCTLVASIHSRGSQDDSQTFPSPCCWTQDSTALPSSAKLFSAFCLGSFSDLPQKVTFPQQLGNSQQTPLTGCFTPLFILFCFLPQEP